MARLRYVGSIDEIKGEYFDVPDELSGAKAREWIELQHEISLIDAELQADAQKAAAEAEAAIQASQPIEESILDQSREADPLDQLREELAGLKSGLERPDYAQLVSAQSSLNSSIQTLHSHTTRAAEEAERISKLATSAQEALDQAESFHTKIQQERQVILNALRMEELKIGEREKRYAALERQMMDLRYDAGQYRTEISDQRRRSKGKK